MFARKCAHIIILPFILAVLVLWLGLECGCIILKVLGLLLLVFGVLLLVFFRDPERPIAEGVCAVADGRIREVSEVGQHIMVSTFMNVHNVHVNRMPLDGRIVSIQRKRGGFKPAFSDKAAENSRVITEVETSVGAVKVVQIAGVFAYRIVPYIAEGQTLKKGDRIGIIRFGSRVDVFLPRDKVEVRVKTGQKVLAGSTAIARLGGAAE